jgi:hypothetical protein
MDELAHPASKAAHRKQKSVAMNAKSVSADCARTSDD